MSFLKEVFKGYNGAGKPLTPSQRAVLSAIEARAAQLAKKPQRVYTKQETEEILRRPFIFNYLTSAEYRRLADAELNRRNERNLRIARWTFVIFVVLAVLISVIDQFKLLR